MGKSDEFKIGEVLFKVEKIPPLRGFEIAEMIRVALGAVDLDTTVGEGEKAEEKAVLKAIASVLTQIPRPAVEELRAALFEFVRFRSPGQPHFQPLRGLEDMAFETLDFTALYEVLYRALYCRFFGCLREAGNRLGFSREVPADSSQ